MSAHQFNATEALQKMRKQKRIARRRAYQASRLNRFRAELVSLRQAGASFRELALWLSREKRMKVTHTTVMRYLEKLLELNV